MTHAFIITPPLIVLLLFPNDFVTMLIAIDHVALSQRPDRWNIRALILTGSFLALVYGGSRRVRAALNPATKRASVSEVRPRGSITSRS